MHDLYIVEVCALGPVFLLLIVYGSIFVRFYTASPGKKTRVRWYVTVVQGHRNWYQSY